MSIFSTVLFGLCLAATAQSRSRYAHYDSYMTSHEEDSSSSDSNETDTPDDSSREEPSHSFSTRHTIFQNRNPNRVPSSTTTLQHPANDAVGSVKKNVDLSAITSASRVKPDGSGNLNRANNNNVPDGHSSGQASSKQNSGGQIGMTLTWDLGGNKNTQEINHDYTDSGSVTVLDSTNSVKTPNRTKIFGKITELYNNYSRELQSKYNVHIDMAYDSSRTFQINFHTKFENITSNIIKTKPDGSSTGCSSVIGNAEKYVREGTTGLVACFQKRLNWFKLLSNELIQLYNHQGTDFDNWLHKLRKCNDENGNGGSRSCKPAELRPVAFVNTVSGDMFKILEKIPKLGDERSNIEGCFGSVNTTINAKFEAIQDVVSLTCPTKL